MLFCSLMMFSCASLPSSSSSAHSSSLITGSYDNVHIPPYAEYEPLTMVFVTTEEYDNIDSPFMTYLALLKKASDIGGHAIVNVSIEESRNCTELNRAVGPYKEKDTACRIKRFGAALAIKYTKVITDGPLVQTPAPQEQAPVQTEKTSTSVLPFL